MSSSMQASQPVDLVRTIAAIAALGIPLCGCVTVTRGTTQAVSANAAQSISVNTMPEQGAQCTLTNSRGTWFLRTPGSAVIQNTNTNLDVTCMKAGYQPGHLAIGADAAGLAGYHYDSPISVILGQPTTAPPPPKPLSSPAGYRS